MIPAFRLERLTSIPVSSLHLQDFRKTQIYLQLLAYRRETQRATSLLEQRTEKLQVVEANARALVGMWEEVETCARYQASEPNAEDAAVIEEIKDAGKLECAADCVSSGSFTDGVSSDLHTASRNSSD